MPKSSNLYVTLLNTLKNHFLAPWRGTYIQQQLILPVLSTYNTAVNTLYGLAYLLFTNPRSQCYCSGHVSDEQTDTQ
jgi:hypothetical protein